MTEREDELDPNAPADREGFGESSLGGAESESDPDPFDERGEDAYEEEELAREEAGAIGGVAGDEDLPPAERPLAEGGEGEAEGFEIAEQDLIESASHGDPAGNPLGDRFTAEEQEAEGLAEYGEADHERVSEEQDEDGDDN